MTGEGVDDGLFLEAGPLGFYEASVVDTIIIININLRVRFCAVII